MSKRIAVFCMPEAGHFQLLRPLIAGLVRHGATVGVFTDVRFESQVRGLGAEFVDLFSPHGLQITDDSSRPFPCRYVSFAGHHAGRVASAAATFRPSLVIIETFALVGRVVAHLLGVPWVNVSPGHDLDPSRYVAGLDSDARVQVSASCLRAVELLRSRYGVPDASPFSFVTSVSPLLNIRCEPPRFLEAPQRISAAPVAFFGSLPSVEEMERRTFEIEDAGPHFPDECRVRIYVSFGTVVWRYFRDEAFAVLRAVSTYIAERPDAGGVMSLGHELLRPDELRRLESDTVRVKTFVDQHALLREADVFVTHNGINSTHEAIYHCVPMLSYPFFWDQPALAARCHDLGLAIPLSRSLRGPVSAEDVAAAMQELANGADERQGRLQQARHWELEVMGGREDILERLIGFA